MTFLEAIKAALNSLRQNKLRAILTLLGIAVGVFSIIGVMTGIGVLRQSIEGGLSQLGSNTFQVQKYPNFGGGHRNFEKYRNRKDLTFSQGQAVEERATFAKTVGLETWQGGQVLKWRNTVTDPNIGVAGESQVACRRITGSLIKEGD